MTDTHNSNLPTTITTRPSILVTWKMSWAHYSLEINVADSCQWLSIGLALNWDVGFPCHTVSFSLSFGNAQCTSLAPLSVTTEAYAKSHAWLYRLSSQVCVSSKLRSCYKHWDTFFVSKILHCISLISFLGDFLFSCSHFCSLSLM